MKKSIFVRTFVIIVGSLLAVQLIALFIVTVFSESIYYSMKLNQAVQCAKNIETYLNDENMSYSEFIYNLEEQSLQSGGRILIIDQANELIYGSNKLSEGGIPLGNLIPRGAFRLEVSESQVFDFKDETGQTVQYLYCKRFESGFLIVISIPVKAISDTVGVIKMILFFTICIAAMISTVGAYLLSRSITAPLLNLNYIAGQMGKLNFSVRYQGNREDEVGQLGQTLNDLSEKLEENIKNLRDELEKEKNLDSLRKQFIAQASHEMQTPIAIINSYREAIEDGMVDDENERERYFEIIKEETDKMSRMVKGMLDLSQIESGTFSISKEYFDIYGLLEAAAEKYQGLAEKQQVVFEYDEESFAREFIIYADRFRLEQVLTNFMTNALKHTNSGCRVILENKEEQGTVKISVWNEGEHVDEQDLPYLWESFYKAKTIAGEKGTGLGLAIAKNILQLHGYEYGAENVEDGVNFWFKVVREGHLIQE